MINTVNNDFIIAHGIIEYNDSTLLSQFEKAQKNVMDRKEFLDNRLSSMDENDYISVAVARLAYDFAKEECSLLLSEIKRRGLTLSN